MHGFNLILQPFVCQTEILVSILVELYSNHDLDATVDEDVEYDQGEEGAEGQGDHREHRRHLYIVTNGYHSTV